MGVIICLGPGGLLSPSASSYFLHLIELKLSSFKRMKQIINYLLTSSGNVLRFSHVLAEGFLRLLVVCMLAEYGHVVLLSLCDNMYLVITFGLKHIGRWFWCFGLWFWGLINQMAPFILLAVVSVCLSVHPSGCPHAACPSICLSACCLSIHLAVNRSICLVFHPSLLLIIAKCNCSCLVYIRVTFVPFYIARH